jgi:phage tail tape-measure protein
MNEKKVETLDANPDVITGAPGAHPVGTGVGAAGGGATGAVIGGVVAGPVGAVVGAAVGGVAGGLMGKGAAEVVNPTVEEAYWRENYANRPYYAKETPYPQYAPAYKYGWESRTQNAGKKFEDVEKNLEAGWDKAKGSSNLAWIQAKAATLDAWHRVERAIPGDADRDGR